MSTKQTALAYELADALNDKKSIEFYLALVQKYSEEFLREKLQIVMATAEDKITRSRAAYFNYLVTKNGKRHNFGN